MIYTTIVSKQFIVAFILVNAPMKLKFEPVNLQNVSSALPVLAGQEPAHLGVSNQEPSWVEVLRLHRRQPFRHLNYKTGIQLTLANTHIVKFETKNKFHLYAFYTSITLFILR